MTHRYEAANLLLQFSDELSKSVYQRKIVEEKFVLNALIRRDNGSTTLATKDLVYASITQGALKGYSKPTIAFIMLEIADNVKMFNLLWQRPATMTNNSQNRKVLKELVATKMLFPTETTGIYLVNPLRIFRGNPITAVEATRELLRENGNKPAHALIRDLRPGDKYVLKSSSDRYELLANDFSPNLLKEPDPDYTPAPGD